VQFATHLIADCALVVAALLAARGARSRHAAEAHLGIQLLPSDARSATGWLARLAARWMVGCAAVTAVAATATWTLVGTVADPVAGLSAALRIGAEALLLATVAALATLTPWRPLLPTALAATVVALWRGHLAFPLFAQPESAARIAANPTDLSADEGARAMSWGSATATFALLALSLFLLWLCLSVPRAPRHSRTG